MKSSFVPADPSGLDDAALGIHYHDDGIIEGVFVDTSENEATSINFQKRSTVKPFLIAVASIAAFGGLLFGFDLGGVGASFLMDGFRHHFHWSCPDEMEEDCSDWVKDSGSIDRDKGLISLFFGIGATVGSLINPPFAERYGRRPCLGVSTVVYLIGASVQTSAPEMWILWLGRFCTGMGIGMLSMVAPVYVAECAPSHVRGSLGIFWDLATTLGIVVASAANMGLKEWEEGWKFAYGGGILFALILLASLILFMPESPRWLAAHRTEEELTKVLALVREDGEMEQEKADLYAEVREKRELGEASWKEVFSRDNMMRRRVFLGFLFFAVQQLSGGTAVMFYAPDILNTFFSEDQAILGTFGLTVIAFVTTIFTAIVVDRFGRTKLLVYGGAMMSVCLIILAGFSSTDESLYLGWAILGFSALFQIANSLSWGPALWVLCSEMFPYRTRGKATGVTTMSHWLFATIIGAVFPVASTGSLAGCFIFFACSIALGTSTVYFLQVETTGMTSTQIDEAFLKHTPTFKRKDW